MEARVAFVIHEKLFKSGSSDKLKNSRGGSCHNKKFLAELKEQRNNTKIKKKDTLASAGVGGKRSTRIPVIGILSFKLYNCFTFCCAPPNTSTILLQKLEKKLAIYALPVTFFQLLQRWFPEFFPY